MNSDLGKKLILCGTALYLLKSIMDFVFILVDLFITGYTSVTLYDDYGYYDGYGYGLFSSSLWPIVGDVIIILALILIAAGFIIRFRSGRSIIDLLTAAFVGLQVIIELMYMPYWFDVLGYDIPDMVLRVNIILTSLLGFVFVVFAMQSNRRNMLISLVTGTFYFILRLDDGFYWLISHMIDIAVDRQFVNAYYSGYSILGTRYIWINIIYTSIYLIMAVIFFIVVLKCMNSSVEQTVTKKESVVSHDGSGSNAISFDSLFGESNDSGEQKTEPVKKSSTPSKKSASDMMDDLFNS